MAWSGTAVLISTLAVCWLVQEPNKVVPTTQTSLTQDMAIAVRSPIMSSLMVTIMLAWLYGNSINPFLVLHLESLRGWCPWWLPAVTYSLPGIAFVLSAYRWSIVGQRWGFERNIMIGLIGGAIGAALLFTARNVWEFAGIYFLTGLCLATLSPAVGAITCTRVPFGFRGRAYGIQQAAGTFSALCAVIIAGQIARFCGYGAIFLFLSGVYLIGIFGFRRLANRWDTALAVIPSLDEDQLAAHLLDESPAGIGRS
jgi:MFS family permease